MIKIFSKILLLVAIFAANSSNGSENSGDKVYLLKDLIHLSKNSSQKIDLINKDLEIKSEEIDLQVPIPDPMITGTYFLFPIETKKGPQRSSIMLSQKIPWPKKRSIMEDKIGFQKKGIEHLKDNYLLTLKEKVSHIYFEIILHKGILDIIKEQLKIVSEYLNIALDKSSVNESSHQEFLDISLEKGLLTKKHLTTEIKLEKLLTRLIYYTKTKIESNQLLSSRVVFKPISKIKENQLVKYWIKNRNKHPFFKSLQSKKEALIAQNKFEKIRQIPDIGINASWMRIDENKQYKNNQDAFSVGLSMTLPIFQKKYSAFKNKAFLELEKLTIEINDLDQQFVQNIRSLSREIINKHKILDLLNQSIMPKAREKLELNRDKFQNSTSTVTDILKNLKYILGVKEQQAIESANIHKLKASLEKHLFMDLEKAMGAKP